MFIGKVYIFIPEFDELSQTIDLPFNTLENMLRS